MSARSRRRAAPAVSAERLATLGVTVINAEARFIGRRRLIAGDTEIRARRYVLATGSAPIVPAIPGIEEIGCLTSDTVFQLGRRPGHLIILGGSSTGLELAQAFRRLGSQVTVLEAVDRAARRRSRDGRGRRPQAARGRRRHPRRRQGDCGRAARQDQRQGADRDRSRRRRGRRQPSARRGRTRRPTSAASTSRRRASR